jgi:hypothetical protein
MLHKSLERKFYLPLSNEPYLHQIIDDFLNHLERNGLLATKINKNFDDKMNQLYNDFKTGHDNYTEIFEYLNSGEFPNKFYKDFFNEFYDIPFHNEITPDEQKKYVNLFIDRYTKSLRFFEKEIIISKIFKGSPILDHTTNQIAILNGNYDPAYKSHSSVKLGIDHTSSHKYYDIYGLVRSISNIMLSKIGKLKLQQQPQWKNIYNTFDKLDSYLYDLLPLYISVAGQMLLPHADGIDFYFKRYNIQEPNLTSDLLNIIDQRTKTQPDTQTGSGNETRNTYIDLNTIPHSPEPFEM